MRETLQPSQRTCHLRFSLVQLAHFLRVQLWLYADRRFSAALREEQDVDGHRAYLQRYLLLYHNYYILPLLLQSSSIKASTRMGH